MLNNSQKLVLLTFLFKDTVICIACAYYGVGDRATNMRMAKWWNDIDSEKLKNSEKTFPNDTLFISSPTWTVVRS